MSSFSISDYYESCQLFILDVSDTSRSGQVQSMGKLSQNEEPSFRKVVAQHKASREKALAQVSSCNLTTTYIFILSPF